ncbi:MAG: ATP-binding cassette domain-containing protein [Nanoarchaeota archaeon]|nr:ATP-binding cassette domain-containing protein [Nanoarchaeota archaeon]
MANPAISVNKLTKKFNGFTAVDDITLSVKKGEIFGLLGPNGAGKTTTINMLSTLLKPTSGTALVHGFDITKQKNDVRKNIGLVFQEPALDHKLTGKENLEFHSMMYGLGREERKKRIAHVISLVELEDKMDVLVENYSGGMKRRLEIARGLIHKPGVLFLDEPTLGLDAQTRRHIWEYIRKLNSDFSVTIILTTHYMEEADYLCKRIAIMDAGKIVAIDAPEKLKGVLGGDVVSLDIDGQKETYIKNLKNLKYVKSIKSLNGILYLTMDKGETKIPELMRIADKANISIRSVNLRKPSLEDVFLHFTGKTIRDSEAGTHEKNRRRMMMHRKRGR